jgi:hypothetical protein
MLDARACCIVVLKIVDHFPFVVVGRRRAAAGDQIEELAPHGQVRRAHLKN